MTSKGVTRKEDRRVRRTQQMLREALFSLIQEKGFEALSVQEIIDRANVGRATFYTHFDNKEDLLVSGFEGLRASLKERQRNALSRRDAAEEAALAFSREMFAHAYGHRALFKAMVGKRSGAAIEQLLHKMLLDFMREDVKAVASALDSSGVPEEALARFLAGAMFGMLRWWLMAKTRLSEDQMDALFRRLAIPVLKAALRKA